VALSSTSPTGRSGSRLSQSLGGLLPTGAPLDGSRTVRRGRGPAQGAAAGKARSFRERQLFFFFELALPPRLDAPGEFEIFAARSFDMPFFLNPSYCFSFFTLARLPGTSSSFP
jgi:hypothetical protein